MSISLKVWWSALKNTERFDHNGKCSLSGVGPDGKNAAGPQDQPCTHLFSTGEFAYLFTQKRDWCCQSSGPKSACTSSFCSYPLFSWCSS